MTETIEYEQFDQSAPAQRRGHGGEADLQSPQRHPDGAERRDRAHPHDRRRDARPAGRLGRRARARTPASRSTCSSTARRSPVARWSSSTSSTVCASPRSSTAAGTAPQAGRRRTGPGRRHRRGASGEAGDSPKRRGERCEHSAVTVTSSEQAGRRDRDRAPRTPAREATRARPSSPPRSEAGTERVQSAPLDFSQPTKFTTELRRRLGAALDAVRRRARRAARR